MAAEDPASSQLPHSPPSAFAGRRVLVVDDNPVNREVALHMLAQLGCTAEGAADGEQAVASHLARHHDLILMDCEMPVLDGYAATRRLRAEPGDRVPILALTARGDASQQDRCREAGMDALLVKPLTPQTLREALATWMDGGAVTGRELPAAGSAMEPGDDIEAVHALFGSHFAELVALYQKDGAPRLAALHQALADGDMALVAKIAHAFGGSSMAIGASGLADLCRTLERDARAGLTEGLGTLLYALEEGYGNVTVRLHSLLGAKAPAK